MLDELFHSIICKNLYKNYYRSELSEKVIFIYLEKNLKYIFYYLINYIYIF